MKLYVNLHYPDEIDAPVQITGVSTKPEGMDYQEFEVKDVADIYKGIEIRERWVPSYFQLLTEWLRQNGAPKYYVEKGDLPSYPWKCTTGGVCSDHKTRKEAQEYADAQNEKEGFPIKDKRVL